MNKVDFFSNHEIKYFAEKLAYLLEKNNTTQKQLADAIGVSRPAISQFVAGISQPTLSNFLLIADYFQVSPEYLAGRAIINPLFRDPCGELYYYFSHNDNQAIFHGSLNYTFGIYRTADDNLKKFLLICDKAPGTLVTTLYITLSHLYFLSLVSLFNWKIQFHYNPFNHPNTDIIIKFDAPENRYMGIQVEPIQPAHLYTISYSSFVDEYSNMSATEKTQYLSNFTKIPNLWDTNSHIGSLYG